MKLYSASRLFILFCFFVFCLSPEANSQNLLANQKNKLESKKGIKWTTDLSWKELLKKAKRENKYIFLDCYATWCGPCKLMDKEVYTDKSVGDVVNRDFISVKVQLDKNKNDNAAVQKWYKDADLILKTYGISAYPTYLFFSPNGELVYREVGYKQTAEFVSIAKNSLKEGGNYPLKRYYELLVKYKNGVKDYSVIPQLLDTASMLSQFDIAEELETDYRQYLSRLDPTELHSKAVLMAISLFLKSSKDTLFTLFWTNERIVDSILQKKGYARFIVDKIIQKEYFQHLIDNSLLSHEPDWRQLQSIIEKRYGIDYAERNVLKAKLKWDTGHHEWAEAAKNLTLLIERNWIEVYSAQEDLFLNHVIWNSVFKRSVDKKEIDMAISCMKGVLERSDLYAVEPFLGQPPSFIDTYANLLYKAGRTREAISWQQKAIDQSVAWKFGEGHINEMKETYSKMKSGKPTWPSYLDKNDFF